MNGPTPIAPVQPEPLPTPQQMHDADSLWSVL
jgi:hypothetical protein